MSDRRKKILMVAALIGIVVMLTYLAIAGRDIYRHGQEQGRAESPASRP